MASEDFLDKKLKNPDDKTSDNKAISKLINDTIRNGGKVYLAGDWHLWLREEKDKPECHKRSDFNTILNEANHVCDSNKDLLIYMGDLVDGEFQEKELLKQALLTLHMKRIMVRGNNDTFDKSFYKSCGFEYVVDSFVWNDILFTHCPVKNDNDINVHSHIHGYHTYIIPYTNHIDVGYYGGRKKPIELLSLISRQPSYAKIIIQKECIATEAHTLFEKCFMDINNIDPYHDNEVGDIL